MTAPTLFTDVSSLRQALAAARQRGRTIGLVPTMGALHEGHLSLVRASQAECDLTVVTIYVNPSQFGPREDLANYPRTLEADLKALSGCGGEILVLVPSDAEVYPPGYATWVEVTSVSRRWEGEYRPIHFRGVATIVLKLFQMVGADVAFFGQKDYQQAQVIQQMVRDLNVPITVRVCPTVREADGLAMSSRNAYLTPAERQQALVLWKSLCLASELVAQGQREPALVAERMQAVIATAPDAQVEYIALVDPQTLEPVATLEQPTQALLAVRLGTTRLIDNCLLEPASARRF